MLLKKMALTAGIAGLALSLFCSGASAAERVLRMGFLSSHNSHFGAATGVFAQEIEKNTEGRYRIELYANSSLGGELEMVEEMQRNHLDGAFVSSATLAGIIPEMGVFDIPFLMRDVRHARAVLDGPIGQEYLEIFRKNGLVGLAWGENGMRHITSSKRPIIGPGDLKGLKIRVPQSDMMIAGFKAFGADAQPLAFPALYGALLSGDFDGQENPITLIMSAELGKVQKYLTLSGHVYSSAVFLLPKPIWNSIPKNDQRVFLAAAQAGAKVSREAAAEIERSGVEQLRRNGIAVTETVNRVAFEQALQGVYAESAAKFGSDVLQRIRSVQ